MEVNPKRFYQLGLPGRTVNSDSGPRSVGVYTRSINELEEIRHYVHDPNHVALLLTCTLCNRPIDVTKDFSRNEQGNVVHTRCYEDDLEEDAEEGNHKKDRSDDEEDGYSE